MRDVSLPALQGMLAQHTEQVYLTCLTITHASLPAPRRRVNDAAPLVRSVGTFSPYPFSVVLPADLEDRLPMVMLVLDNVDRDDVELVRSGAVDEVVITLEVVTAATPNVVEAGPFDFYMKEARGNQLTLECTLGYEDVLNEPFPALTFTPRTAAGLF